MDRLSSCYFCGAALDVSLSEYPVVPRALQTDDTSDRSVVLCPTCRRKLGTIVESVVAAASDEDVESTLAGTAETLPSAADDEDLSEMFDESGMEPQPDPMDVGEANETVEDEEDDTQADEAVGTIDSQGESGRSRDERSEWAGANGERAAAESADGDQSTDSEPASARDSRSAADETGDSEPTSADTTAESDSKSAGDTSQSSDDNQSLTRLEYNKVMRLLQNRELPVERAEIRTVAVNAYEIEPAEFDTIVDAAIDRDLIAERDGQLVAPE